MYRSYLTSLCLSLVLFGCSTPKTEPSPKLQENSVSTTINIHYILGLSKDFRLRLMTYMETRTNGLNFRLLDKRHLQNLSSFWSGIGPLLRTSDDSAVRSLATIADTNRNLIESYLIEFTEGYTERESDKETLNNQLIELKQLEEALEKCE